MFIYRKYWTEMHQPASMKRPLDCFEQVAAVLGEPGAPAPEVDWDEVRQQLGVAPPADYRRFVDRFGAGWVGALRVFAPRASTPSFDLFRQVERVTELTTEFRGSTTPTFPGPYHPQEGGLIVWGEMDGLHFFWNPAGADPDAWPVMISDESWLMTFTPDKSFTLFLADYLAGKNAGSGAPLLSPDEGVGVRFVPAS
ncbi:hypothetical protein FHX81_2520 [Saccharothrix saharensis]|uniref:SUKH superfamily protein n=1 Tax=Saccharothrix saharensis TaxID=571190 RepID=A0A543JBG9_9PSEU|nr:hypothetical protein FHX81_2520 [Saccharothrix saharensis]